MSGGRPGPTVYTGAAKTDAAMSAHGLPSAAKPLEWAFGVRRRTGSHRQFDIDMGKSLQDQLLETGLAKPKQAKMARSQKARKRRRATSRQHCAPRSPAPTPPSANAIAG